ncbi:MAG: transposase [Solirubrobacterales bacterium]
MASRNELKDASVDSGLFHVYNRGVGRANIFRDGADFQQFLDCLSRYVDIEPRLDLKYRTYVSLRDRVSVVSYCLMPNHYHLIVKQHVAGGMRDLMQRAMGGYVKYFNGRYDRPGPLFQGRYKASQIGTARYARRAVAYVHLNNEELGRDFRWSSHRIYADDHPCRWLDVEAGLALFGDLAGYLRYLDAYEKPRSTR